MHCTLDDHAILQSGSIFLQQSWSLSCLNCKLCWYYFVHLVYLRPPGFCFKIASPRSAISCGGNVLRFLFVQSRRRWHQFLSFVSAHLVKRFLVCRGQLPDSRVGQRHVAPPWCARRPKTRRTTSHRKGLRDKPSGLKRQTLPSSPKEPGRFIEIKQTHPQ